MVTKLLDIVRQAKQDFDNKELDWAKLEIEINKIEHDIEIELQKMEILRQKSDLENQKLKIEIEKISDKDLVSIDSGVVFRKSDILTIHPGRDAYVMQLKNVNHFIELTQGDVEEIKSIIKGK